MRIKPILFNADMVRAILDGRKTVTRRLVKPQPPVGATVIRRATDMWMWKLLDFDKDMMPPYQPRDILYVRETWREYNGEYYYKADEPQEYDGYFTKKLPCAPKWHPSIHMPKEEARIWLRVTDVRAERLQDITWEDVYREGLENPAKFNELWDSTVKKKDLPLYGWDASPWVWVIEFERCEKPEEYV